MGALLVHFSILIVGLRQELAERGKKGEWTLRACRLADGAGPWLDTSNLTKEFLKTKTASSTPETPPTIKASSTSPSQASWTQPEIWPKEEDRPLQGRLLGRNLTTAESAAEAPNGCLSSQWRLHLPLPAQFSDQKPQPDPPNRQEAKLQRTESLLHLS